MAWEIVTKPEFTLWYDGLTATEQEGIAFVLGILAENGPLLGRPYVDTLNGSNYANMKEIRQPGSPVRALFAFDPTRTAVLLVGGDKSGDKKFYQRIIRLADAIYAQHLETLE